MDTAKIVFLSGDDVSAAPFVDFLVRHAEAFRGRFARGG